MKALRVSLVFLISVCVVCRGQTRNPGSTVSVTVQSDAMLIGHEQLQGVKWPRRLLEEPTDEGQFEILVSKSALSAVQAPGCRQTYLLVRMPGVLYSDPAFDAKVKARKEVYSHLVSLSQSHSPISMRLEAPGYGNLNQEGKLQLTGCNLWFAQP